jgi:SAM-dependent methyltransferase
MAAMSRTRARGWRRRWDRDQSLFIVDREERFATMVAWTGALVGRRPRVLDLGCGTGAVAERVLAGLPGARVVAVDYDPVLLKIARTGLGTLGGRVTWVDTDLRAANWTRALPAGRYDAAVSSTALHWLTAVQLGRMYQALARRIRPGGVFLNADSLHFGARAPRLARAGRRLAERPSATRRAGWNAWTKFWEDIEHDPDLTEEVSLRHLRYPHEHSGTPTPDLLGHARLLRRAGFREVALVYSRGESRVLAAVR